MLNLIIIVGILGILLIGMMLSIGAIAYEGVKLLLDEEGKL